MAVCVPALINVAFLTLIERKILGLAQFRKGPNKVSTIGLLQPFSDAVKLFIKEDLSPVVSNFAIFSLRPCMSLCLILCLWTVVPIGEVVVSYSVSLLCLIVILRLGLYPILVAGWASNSKYALIGALRAVAQTVSYEVRLAIILIRVLRVSSSMRLISIVELNSLGPLVLYIFPLITLWLVSCLAETNRTPFDFAEGESELVSGFNIEYGAGGFALIFIAEYGRILFMRAVTSAIVMGTRLSAIGACAVTILVASV